jgi:hypothetical protein
VTALSTGDYGSIDGASSAAPRGESSRSTPPIGAKRRRRQLRNWWVFESDSGWCTRCTETLPKRGCPATRKISSCPRLTTAPDSMIDGREGGLVRPPMASELGQVPPLIARKSPPLNFHNDRRPTGSRQIFLGRCLDAGRWLARGRRLPPSSPPQSELRRHRRALRGIAWRGQCVISR